LIFAHIEQVKPSIIHAPHLGQRTGSTMQHLHKVIERQKYDILSHLLALTIAPQNYEAKFIGFP
jgi:hypothetical protein